MALPIIDGKVRNPERHRYYGLDVGDRVRFKPWKEFKYGTVDTLGGMDNNGVYVLWDGKAEPVKEVAEWMTRVDENNEPLKNRYA